MSFKEKSRGTVVVLTLMLGAGSARAQSTHVWNGLGTVVFGDNDMNLGGFLGNWTVPELPPPVNGAGTILVFNDANTFAGGFNPAANRNYTGIDTIRFQGAGSSFNITGSGSFSFFDGGGVVNDATSNETIAVPLFGTGDTMVLTTATNSLVLSGDINLSHSGGVMLIVNAGTGTINLTGDITGPGGSLMFQGGQVFVLGNNTYSGGTELAAGTLFLGQNTSLGSGALFVTGDSELQSLDDGDNLMIGNTVSLLNASLLTIGGSSDLALTGSIFGNGGLILDMTADNDVLTLAGSNSYSGGTMLMKGTLVLGSDTALGTGDLEVAADGSLQTTAAITVNNAMDLSAQLTISGANDVTLGGDITGSGSLLMDFDADNDVLTLGGNNDYEGGTTLNKGTLVLASNTALSTVAVTITGDSAIQSTTARTIDNDFTLNNSTLTFSGAGSLDLTGTIDEIFTGTLTVDLDAGQHLSLTGSHTYTGVTTVNGGEFRLDNASLLSSIVVNDGGTMTGNATLDGDLTLNFGGTMTGSATIDGDMTVNSGGTMTGSAAIDGDLMLDTGSTFVVSIDGDTNTVNLLDLTGTATLAIGSMIEASLSGTDYVVSGQTFTIIDADGGIIDNGADFMETSATLTISLMPNVTPNTYGLQVIRPLNAYSMAANPGNNTTIGLALDSLIPVADADPTGDAGGLLAQLDSFLDPRYNQAVTELSPEPYNAIGAISRANTTAFTQLQSNYMSGRRTLGNISASSLMGPAPGSLALSNDDPFIMAAAIAQAEDAKNPPPGRAYEWESRWGGYAEAQGIFIDQDTTTNRTGFNGTSVGGQFGLDYTFDGGLLAGVAFGFLSTNVDLDAGLGEIDQEMYRLGPYLSWYSGDWYIDMSLSFGYSTNDSARKIPALGLTADGSYDSYDLTGYVGTGYRFEVGENFYVSPIGSVVYSYIDYDGFTETGAGGANLTVPSRTDDTLRTRVGVNLSYRFEDVGWQPVVYAYGGWEHEFFEDSNITAQFASGGNPFTIDVGSRGDDAVFGGLGIDVLVYEQVAAYFRLEVVGGDDSIGLGLAGGFRWAF